MPHSPLFLGAKAGSLGRGGGSLPWGVHGLDGCSEILSERRVSCRSFLTANCQNHTDSQAPCQLAEQERGHGGAWDAASQRCSGHSRAAEVNGGAGRGSLAWGGGADVTPAWDSAKKHLSGLAVLEAGKANLTSPRPPGFPDLSHLAMASLKRWGVLSAKSQPKCIP